MNFNTLFLIDPFKFSIENIIYDPLLFGSVKFLYRHSGLYNFSILDFNDLKRLIPDSEQGKKNLLQTLEGTEILLRQHNLTCKYLVVDDSINSFPRILGYYFPYYSHSIGYIDIPIYPNAGQGRFAFTPYLTGCTICVKKHLDQRNFRVFHVPSSIHSTKPMDKKYWIELREKI